MGGLRGLEICSFYFCIFSSEVGDFDPNSCTKQTHDIKVCVTCLYFVNPSVCPIMLFTTTHKPDLGGLKFRLFSGTKH